jgi:hypothetical protein
VPLGVSRNTAVSGLMEGPGPGGDGNYVACAVVGEESTQPLFADRRGDSRAPGLMGPKICFTTFSITNISLLLWYIMKGLDG